MNRLLVLACMIVVLAGFGRAQNFTYDGLMMESAKMGVPEESLSDDAGVLDLHPELKAALQKRLDDLEKDFGYRIYVLIRPVWLGGTVHEMAAILQSSWFPKGDGLVMVIESDNRKLGLGTAMQNHPDQDDWLMPTHVSSHLVKRVADRADYDAPLEEFLDGLITDMVQEHRQYFELRASSATSWLSKDSLFVLALLVLLALVAGSCTMLIQRTNAREARSHYRFPEVTQPERLGAPYGGGQVVVRQFVAKDH